LAAWWLLGLAAVGAAISFYFTLAYYGRIRSGEVPAALCQRDEHACLTILRTPYARMFSVPNALVGLGLYALTATTAGLTLAGRLPLWLWELNVALAVVAVLLAPYLVWALAARLKVWCRL
jgi:uncharacterized membrane protein